MANFYTIFPDYAPAFTVVGTVRQPAGPLSAHVLARPLALPYPVLD